MATQFRFLCPAKINLILNVVGHSKNHYHELQSLFVPINIYDELYIKKTSRSLRWLTIRGKFSAQIPHNENNLICRAVRLVQGDFHQGCHITLVKNIPTGAGLGGGSSNVATVLNFFVQKNAKEKQTQALQLGADVPFFLQKKPRWVMGVGDVMGPTVSLPQTYLLLLWPNISLPTKEVFDFFKNSHDPLTPKVPLVKLRRGFKSVQVLAEVLHNDLEKHAIKLAPQIAEAKSDLLKSGALAAVMSGSGSTVVGIYASLETRLIAWKQVCARWPSSWVQMAEPIGASPSW